MYTTQDGRYVIDVNGGRYIAGNINGPYTFSSTEFNTRDHAISGTVNYLHNKTFARREDGSFLMVNRHGGIWFSKDGISDFNRVTEKSVYPAAIGKYEDPVVWKDNIQYHLIVNDWMGRIAWYLRSKDGVHWKEEPGEAYMPGVSIQANGNKEDWFKYERIKILQDKYGRAVAANFAVIDTSKYGDLANDNHSSKLITLPLTAGRLLTLADQNKITPQTNTISVIIQAEKDFNPQTDIDFTSLRFGTASQVNFGKGSKLLKTETKGNDLILVFEGKGNGLAADDFVAKLMGKTTTGKLLFGFARLPWVNYIEPILSTRLPKFTQTTQGFSIDVEVENFGQVASKNASIKILINKDGRDLEIGTAPVPPLQPFEKKIIKLSTKQPFNKGLDYEVTTVIDAAGLQPVPYTK